METLDDDYSFQASRGRLFRHATPDHSPGRERMDNHSKILARQLEDPAGDAYGWVYVGSHNLTVAAWGRVTVAGSEWVPNDGALAAPCVWINNRELGVLLVQRRSEAGSLFQRTPLPWGA